VQQVASCGLEDSVWLIRACSATPAVRHLGVMALYLRQMCAQGR
jgi:hypothetical protein